MNRDEMSGRWTETKGKIKEKWGKLTDDDLDVLEGKWDQLSGLVQQRYGIAKEQAERDVNELRRQHEAATRPVNDPGIDPDLRTR
jgi:uncharacterized protein YjbJ (UPF0337 family)